MIRYAVTQRSSFSGDEARRTAELIRQAERWAADGIDFVQLREKDMQAGALAELAGRLIETLGAHIKLLVNGRADVALSSGAAGVHLTAHPDELTPEQVRQIFTLAGAAPPIISISCHTLDEVRRQRDAGADLILFGPVFEKRVQDRLVAEGVGLQLLQQACETSPGLSVLAIGGVTPHHFSACLRAGAAGVAGIRSFGAVLL